MGLAVPDYPYGCAQIQQTFDDNAPPWAIKVKEQFEWLDLRTVTVNCVKPGCIIPPHRDGFFRMNQYIAENNIDVKGKIPIRVNLFLQDFMMGHFLQIGDEVFSNYLRGDWTFIHPGVVHTVSNTSNHNRYTLQVTGMLDADSEHLRGSKVSK